MTENPITGPAPLAGVKVVDLSKILAGPYATMSFADLGAEVTKVEHPEGGDPTRAWGPPFVGDDATYYLAVNRGKKSVTLDLKSEEGQRIVHRMLEDADVVVENFKPGSGLQQIFDYRALSERHPHLVVLHISAFGDEGPMRDQSGYDMVAQAAGGLMSLTGEPGGAPMKSGFAMGDLGAALFGVIGTVDHASGPLEQIAFPVNFGGTRPPLRSAPPCTASTPRMCWCSTGRVWPNVTFMHFRPSQVVDATGSLTWGEVADGPQRNTGKRRTTL